MFLHIENVSKPLDTYRATPDKYREWLLNCKSESTANRGPGSYNVQDNMKNPITAPFKSTSMRFINQQDPPIFYSLFTKYPQNSCSNCFAKPVALVEYDPWTQKRAPTPGKYDPEHLPIEPAPTVPFLDTTTRTKTRKCASDNWFVMERDRISNELQVPPDLLFKKCLCHVLKVCPKCRLKVTKKPVAMNFIGYTPHTTKYWLKTTKDVRKIPNTETKLKNGVSMPKSKNISTNDQTPGPAAYKVNFEQKVCTPIIKNSEISGNYAKVQRPYQQADFYEIKMSELFMETRSQYSRLPPIN